MNFSPNNANNWTYNNPFNGSTNNQWSQNQSLNNENTNKTPWTQNKKTATDVRMNSNPWTYNKKSTIDTNQKFSKLDEKIKKLEKKIDTISLNISKRKYLEISHQGIVCNNCQKQNINGIRYLCGNCQQYNLCNKCIIYAEEIHPNNHFFIRIPDSRIWNQMNNIPQQPTHQNFNI
jgi:Zn-dependent metalloprotease